jgi:hypothetical protein
LFALLERRRIKALLIEMAQKWRELARKLEGKGGEIPDDG